MATCAACIFCSVLTSTTGKCTLHPPTRPALGFRPWQQPTVALDAFCGQFSAAAGVVQEEGVLGTPQAASAAGYVDPNQAVTFVIDGATRRFRMHTDAFLINPMVPVPLATPSRMTLNVSAIAHPLVMTFADVDTGTSVIGASGQEAPTLAIAAVGTHTLDLTDVPITDATSVMPMLSSVLVNDVTITEWSVTPI